MKLRDCLMLLICVSIPWVVFHSVANGERKNHMQPVLATVYEENTTQEKGDEKQQLISFLNADGMIEQIELDAYITGVVLAEMPAQFEPDALMAQAVAARTYTLKRFFEGSKHGNADVCTKASCCQAYMTYEEYLQRGGVKEDYDRVCDAVFFTAGNVLKYNDEFIEATYFSCSGGVTEAAVSVWGTDIPYLISQPSYGEESADVYAVTTTFTKEKFLSMLELEADSEINITDVTYTAGGGIDTIVICGSEFTGSQLRQRLGLYSTNCMISVVGSSVIITTRGYGHRVGMSQYGAEAMAVEGNDYKEILSYYYPGTELVDLY